MVSEAAGLAIKLASGAEAGERLREEIETLSDPALARVGLAPRILASGREGDETAWMALEFCALHRPRSRAAYMETLRHDVLPRLFDFWGRTGIELESGAAFLRRLSAGMERTGLGPALAEPWARVKALYDQADELVCPRVITHGDLQARHLMHGADGRLVVIDWDVMGRRSHLADLQRIAPAAELFQPLTGGRTSFIRPPFQPILDAMGDWARRNGGSGKAPALAFLMAASAMERVIETVEKRAIPFERQERMRAILRATGLMTHEARA